MDERIITDDKLHSAFLDKFYDPSFLGCEFTTTKPPLIHLRGIEKDPKQDFDIHDKLFGNIWNTATNDQSVVVFGDSGSGKSTVALNLAKHCWDTILNGGGSSSSNCKRIPIYIPLGWVQAILGIDVGNNLVRNFLKSMLESANISIYDITQLLKTVQILLILDCYDELVSDINLWEANAWHSSLSNVNANSVVFCRHSRYIVLSRFLRTYFPSGTHHYNLQRLKKLAVKDYIEEVVHFLRSLDLSMLNQNSDEMWVKTKTVTNQTDWETNCDKYLEWSNKILYCLSDRGGVNPFILRMVVQILPISVQSYANEETSHTFLDKLKGFSLTELDVYESFTKRWFIYGSDRIHSLKLPRLCEIPKEILVQLIDNYCRNLAYKIQFCNNGFLANYIPERITRDWDLWVPNSNTGDQVLPESICSKFPQSEYDTDIEKCANLKALRDASFLHKNTDSYSFIHFSILEFFASKEVFLELRSKLNYYVMNLKLPKDTNIAFNEHYLTSNEYSGIMTMLANMALLHADFKDLLLQVIEHSKTTPGIGTMSSNAGSVLSLAGFSFSGMDISNAQFQKADLTRSIFAYANLSGSDLAEADLTQAWWVGCSLKAANLKDCTIDLKVYLLNGEDKYSVLQLVLHSKQCYVLLGNLNKGKYVIKCFDLQKPWREGSTFGTGKVKRIGEEYREAFPSLFLHPNGNIMLMNSGIAEPLDDYVDYDEGIGSAEFVGYDQGTQTQNVTTITPRKGDVQFGDRYLNLGRGQGQRYDYFILVDSSQGVKVDCSSILFLNVGKTTTKSKGKIDLHFKSAPVFPPTPDFQKTTIFIDQEPLNYDLKVFSNNDIYLAILVSGHIYVVNINKMEFFHIPTTTSEIIVATFQFCNDVILFGYDSTYSILTVYHKIVNLEGWRKTMYPDFSFQEEGSLLAVSGISENMLNIYDTQDGALLQTIYSQESASVFLNESDKTFIIHVGLSGHLELTEVKSVTANYSQLEFWDKVYLSGDGGRAVPITSKKIELQEGRQDIFCLFDIFSTHKLSKMVEMVPREYFLEWTPVFTRDGVIFIQIRISTIVAMKYIDWETATCTGDYTDVHNILIGGILAFVDTTRQELIILKGDKCYRLKAPESLTSNFAILSTWNIIPVEGYEFQRILFDPMTYPRSVIIEYILQSNRARTILYNCLENNRDIRGVELKQDSEEMNYSNLFKLEVKSGDWIIPFLFDTDVSAPNSSVIQDGDRLYNYTGPKGTQTPGINICCFNELQLLFSIKENILCIHHLLQINDSHSQPFILELFHEIRKYVVLSTSLQPEETEIKVIVSDSQDTVSILGINKENLNSWLDKTVTTCPWKIINSNAGSNRFSLMNANLHNAHGLKTELNTGELIKYFNCSGLPMSQLTNVTYIRYCDLFTPVPCKNVESDKKSIFKIGDGERLELSDDLWCITVYTEKAKPGILGNVLDQHPKMMFEGIWNNKQFAFSTDLITRNENDNYGAVRIQCLKDLRGLENIDTKYVAKSFTYNRDEGLKKLNFIFQSQQAYWVYKFFDNNCCTYVKSVVDTTYSSVDFLGFTVHYPAQFYDRDTLIRNGVEESTWLHLLGNGLRAVGAK